jgi:thioesterase domain-containing protein
MLRIYKANNKAALNYVPQIYPNSITLLRTSNQSNIAHQDPTLGWSNLVAGKVEVHWVPGNHLTMLKNPHVQVLSEQLRACIENVRTINH